MRILPSWRVWSGLLLILGAYCGSQWVIQKFTLPGHMSVLEAQASDMSTMKPSVGAIPVATFRAIRQQMQATVRYTGSAVSYTDQDISARVPGTITWMPAYPGMHVHRGQTLVRLDTRELDSRIREQNAAVTMAEHAIDVSRISYRQALSAAAQAKAQVEEARDEAATTQSELVSAHLDVTAAEEDRASAQADLEGTQTGIADAQAQRAAAQADQTYWRIELERSQELFNSGVTSRQKLQQDQNQVANANAKVAQAEARLQQIQASIRSAQGRVKKADAMLASARAKVNQAESRIRASQSKILQMQANYGAQVAAADTAQHAIIQAQAGKKQSAAQLATARVIASYAEIVAERDGVVTQRLISPGTLVQPGQPILKISQISPLRLQANVAESDLPNIHVGNVVRVSTMKDPQHPVFARLSALFPAADPSSRTSIVEALLPNTTARLLPGEFLTMDITLGANKNSLVVPAGALVALPKATSPTLATEETQAVWTIVPGQLEHSVYTCTMHPEVKQDHSGKCPKCKMDLVLQSVGGKWRAHLVPVITGTVNEKFVEIRSGLTEGAQVIYAGQEGLREGDPVVTAQWGASGPLALPPATGEIAPGTLYTCLMHPEVIRDHPGKCPKCNMDLVPTESVPARSNTKQTGGAQ